MSVAVVSTQDMHDVRLEAKLRREFGIVWDLMHEAGVQDIELNPDGHLWVKRAGRSKEFHSEFSGSQAGAALATIAHITGQTLNSAHPVLETTVPFNGSRIEGIISPIVLSPTFAIRCPATQVYTLADYVASGVLSERHKDALETAILARRNILTVGGTASGKTTFSNALLDSMAKLTPSHRVAIIEDTGELQCKVENSFALLARGSVTMEKCLKICMRMTPDRIIVGEVRGGEALSLLKGWNSGHDGGFATIHANDARAGLVKLESYVEEATTAPKQLLIAEAVNLVVFIGLDSSVPAGRRVKEVYEVVGYDKHKGTYQFAEL